MSAIERPIYVYRDNANGDLYHNSCFDDEETREGFTAVVNLNDLQPDDECAACQVTFLESVMGDPDEDDDC